MASIIEASCVAGVVTAQNVPVEGTTILSNGIGESSGVLLLSGLDKAYVANTTPDLKLSLDKLTAALTDLILALGLIDAKPTGGSGSSVTPVAAANVVNLTAINAELIALKEVLK